MLTRFAAVGPASARKVGRDMLDRFKVPEDIAVRVPDATMRTAVERIFTALGMGRSDAAKCAEPLIYADVRGIDSHGVSNMMRAYVAGLKGGHINPTPTMKRVRDFPAAVSVDGDRGLGLGQGKELMELACERARDNGVGVVTAFNSGHYGAAAYYAHLALQHDMVGMSMTSGGLQVAPTQGAEPLLGLNPLGIAAPSKEEPPFIFDASMSSVAGNKIHLLQRLGGRVLPGWITDAEGAPVMEEAEVPDRYLMLPLGGTREIGSHKGFGLSMLVEILCKALPGTGAGPHRRQGSGHHFMAYNIAAFGDVDLFKKDMDAYLRSILDCKPAPGESRVVYPGIPEHEAEIDRRENGIPYHPEVIEWFNGVMEQLGLESPFA